MNARHTAFYRQAQSDWRVFLHLHSGPTSFPVCHELHYLQMCTEKLSKVYYKTDLGTQHAAFRRFLTDLPSNPSALAPLGFAAIADLTRWQGSVKPIVDAIEDLAPSIADKKGLPNPEYPWPRSSPTVAPADHDFAVEVYSHLDAQDRCGEPAFLAILGKMVNTMQSARWHL